MSGRSPVVECRWWVVGLVGLVGGGAPNVLIVCDVSRLPVLGHLGPMALDKVLVLILGMGGLGSKLRRVVDSGRQQETVEDGGEYTATRL